MSWPVPDRRNAQTACIEGFGVEASRKSHLMEPMTTISHPVAPPVAPCAVESVDERTSPRMAVTGDLDLFTYQPFQAAVAWLRPLSHGLEIDLSSAEFIDSMGLRALLEASTACEDDARVSPTLLDTSPATVRLLERTGVCDLFRLQSSADQRRSG